MAMDPTAEISKEIVVPIVKRLLRFVKEHLTYMISYKKNVEKMSSRAVSLEGKIKMVRDQVLADEIRSVPIQPDVTTWIAKAENSLEKAKEISGKEDVVSKGCLNLKQRYILGKGASDKLQEINNLLEEKLNIIFTRNETPLGRVGSVVAAVSEKAIHRLPSMVQMDGFAAFDSRKQVYENVLKLLFDDKTRLMAIYGMGGVGKTTMIKHLEKTAKEKHLFHWILKATVSSEPNVYKIQQELADGMNRNLVQESLEWRAKQLSEAFEKISKDEKGSKKILVILDDVWEALDLEQVGLSRVAASFKIILTTRNKDVCTIMKVGADAIFKLEVLQNEESWNLFQETVEFQNFTDDPELKEVAEEIVKECAGLPLAIRMIAETLKSKSKSKWMDALRRLRNSDIGEKLNVVLETSFKYLEEDDTREVFLLCLFPEDYHIPIEELARYAIGLRLYKDIHLMGMEDVRNRTKACAEELTGVNLLLESEYEDCVKMHDLVRDFGLNHCKNTWLVKHGKILQWPRQDSDEP